MKRAFLCFLLCLALLLPTLIACGGEEPTAPNSPDARPNGPANGPAATLFESAKLQIPCNDTLEIGTTGALLSSCAHNAYLYYALRDDNGGVQLCRRDLQSDAAATKGTAVLSGDAVSMCYNTDTNLLVIANGDSTVSTVDPETLELVETYDTSSNIVAITYLQSEGVYTVRYENKNALADLDADFVQTRIRSLPSGSSDYTILDVTSDSEYIYLLVDSGKNASARLRAGVLIYHIESARCLKNVFALDTSSRTLTTLSVNGNDFLVGTASFIHDDVFFKGALVPAEQERPAELIGRVLENRVDSKGLSSKMLFKTYPLAGNLGSHTVMQGGGTDGKYAYFCMEDQKNDYHNTPIHTTRLVKVDMETCELVDVSEPLSLGHSNDLCYNSRTNKLLVVHCGFTSEDTARVSIVDPDTLTVEEVITLPFGTHCMSYDETSDRYIVGRSRNFAILDSNFQVLVSKVNVGSDSFCKEEELITQGCDSDSEYVYFVYGGRNSGGPWVNYLVAYDWNGNMVTAKVIPNMTEESENIFHIGNTIYVACNGNNAPVYEITIQP